MAEEQVIVLVKTTSGGRLPVGEQLTYRCALVVPRSLAIDRAFRQLARTHPDENAMRWRIDSATPTSGPDG